MTTAIEQAGRNQDCGEYLDALDAFAESNGFLEERETLINVDNLMAAFEAQGVLPIGEEGGGEFVLIYSTGEGEASNG